MGGFSRFVSVLLLLAYAAPLSAAEDGAERGAFFAARKLFEDRFYSKAETEFEAFAQRFTNSARLPEAMLLQARARLHQGNHDGAISLLAASLPKAGNMGDE